MLCPKEISQHLTALYTILALEKNYIFTVFVYVADIFEFDSNSLWCLRYVEFSKSNKKSTFLIKGVS